MRRLLWTLAGILVLASSGAEAAVPRAFVSAGNVLYSDDKGATHRLTAPGLDSEAVLSPDGTKIAFVRTEAKATQQGDGDHTALYLMDVSSGRSLRVGIPHDGKRPEDQFISLSSPVFSLDGGFVYVLAEAWATSAAVHQINLATGAERYVVAGNSDRVIRSGPYRGYLLVAQHRYWPAGGSYNPTYVVRPDGHEMFRIPGTQAEDGVDHLAAWLGQNHWSAW